MITVAPKADESLRVNHLRDSRRLTYLNNRYHDPAIGNFISVDPLVGKTGTPYLYTGGNPVTFADPSGLDRCDNPNSQGRCSQGWAAKVWVDLAPSTSLPGTECGASGGSGPGHGCPGEWVEPDANEICGFLASVCTAVQQAVDAGQLLEEKGAELVGALLACMSDAVSAVVCASEAMQVMPGGSAARDVINRSVNDIVMSVVSSIGDCGASDGITICVVPQNLQLSGTVTVGDVTLDLSVIVPTAIDFGGTTVGSIGGLNG